MRLEKSTIVDDVKVKLNASPFVILLEYGGMSVPHFSELRSRLAAVGSTCSVVKNTFLRRALNDTGTTQLDAYLTGQTAIVAGEQDICAAAKVLKAFHAEFQKPVVRAGVLDSALLSFDQIMVLASLPSKQALQSQLLGLLQMPATQFVRTLNEPGTSLARLLLAKVSEKAS
jgi:large subunit ribosomal protein L10